MSQIALDAQAAGLPVINGLQVISMAVRHYPNGTTITYHRYEDDSEATFDQDGNPTDWGEL